MKKNIIIEGLVIFGILSIFKILFLVNDVNELVKQNMELHDALNNRECLLNEK